LVSPSSYAIPTIPPRYMCFMIPLVLCDCTHSKLIQFLEEFIMTVADCRTSLSRKQPFSGSAIFAQALNYDAINAIRILALDHGLTKQFT
jgi:hypothetical protein